MIFNPHEKGPGWRASAAEQDEIVFKAVFPEAQGILKENKIKLVDFTNLYGAERVARDRSLIEEKQKAFEAGASPDKKDAKKQATIFEGVFHEGVNKHGWLGEGVRVVGASDFDDWENGIDGIVEFKGPDKVAQHLALGVDVTFSGQLAGKFEKIKDAILTGKLGTVDYFHSGNFRGELKNISQVVVGIDRGHLVNLAREVFIRPDRMRLSRHPVQILQLREIVAELDAFAVYASRIGKGDIAETLRRDEAIVRKILQKKNAGEGVRIGDWQDDKVFRAIEKELKAFI